jgi:hypothetical protein
MNQGSAPEVVKHGKTGFVVNSLIEMVHSVDKISGIERTAAAGMFWIDLMLPAWLRIIWQLMNRNSQYLCKPV